MKRLITAAMIGLFSMTSVYALAAEKAGPEHAPAVKHAKKHYKKSHSAKRESMKQHGTTAPATPAKPENKS